MRLQITMTIAISFVVSHSFAQSTWAYVYSLFQNNGCTSSCHNGTGSSSLDLYGAGDRAKVYDNLVNVTPTNPAAIDKHNKLVYPGIPELSFLLRKINSGFDENLAIEASEGDDMPVNYTPMRDSDIEIIRQWILYGAKETTSKVDTTLIRQYYNDYGSSPYFAGKRQARPTAPSSTEGFQMHFGPVFLSPKTETEVNIKIPLFHDQDIDITRIDEFQNYYSHHFILYEYTSTSTANSTSSGIRTVDDLSEVSSGNMVAAWAYTKSISLPSGTAYKMSDTTWFDFNYHIPNSNPDSIIAAEIYLNIYAATQSSTRQQMYSALTNYGMGGSYPYALYLSNLNQYDTLADATYDSNSSDSLYIWLLSSHTHKYGVDYDIYKRNSNGTRGDQLYEGYYNEDYSFNQGYYDWEHPAVRYFDPLEAVSVSDGLIHEAVYYNSGTQAVGYGLTTEDEMMLFFMQFTLSPIEVDTSSNGIDDGFFMDRVHDFSISPNPASEILNITYSLNSNANVTLEVHDMLGKVIKVLLSENQIKGDYKYLFDDLEISPGIYNVNLIIDSEFYSRKFIYQSKE
jgi:hypothetical protein